MNAASGSIRLMQQEDLAAVYEVYLLAHLDEYSGETATFAPQGISESPVLSQLFEQCDVFVYDDGTVKGFVGNRNERISWLYVHPDYRGQKIGRQLIDFMLERLGGQAAISVIKSNKLALSLYSKRGFKVFGDFTFAYQDVPVEVYSMRLGPPAS
ncbi:MAG: GNAT family N-acetyltransferase [Thiolinea sp.]